MTDKIKPKLKSIFLPELAVNRVKKLCADKQRYIQDWMLDAAAAAYKTETGLDLLEPDEHETNAI